MLKFPDTEEEKGEETMKKNACLMRLTVEVECKSSKEILKFYGIGSDSKAPHAQQRAQMKTYG